MRTKMRKKMRNAIVLTAVVLGVSILSGCGPEAISSKAGFLSDYSRLQTRSSSSLRYVNEQALRRYSAYMIDPVGVYFHSGASGIEEKTKGNLTKQDMRELTNYMHTVLVKAVEASGKRVAYRSGSGVARIRTAITDIDRSSLTTLVPISKVAGFGLGGATLEVEVIDSRTKEQIGALVETQKGSRIPFAGLGRWDAAKQAMDDWGRRLQKRLEQTR